MTHDPFEEVTPPSPLNGWAVLTSTLQKEMLWDIVGPQRLVNDPEKLGVKPSSKDVFDMERRDMMERKYSLMPIRNELSLLSYVAGQVASDAVIALDDRYKFMDEDELLSFKELTINMGSVITDAVISHLFQQGLIHYGGHS